ncbi:MULTISPECIES: PACE efflux transporter [unclassified Herbaspirillum]|uniref:PACE efflux transporter n=1 Tax=unclassified Herbaspirillum TaxID=2624150 RepID=UPI0011530C7B|nr:MULTISPECIES: PACE efflux transporter [unclassified Herbaspirillum]MBB5390034.1 putative membrane protein [Herbaspirillum sp. SJZ102]TQK09464.1 putative membrane protein [Herbaspirillum sp. SJZ130]TQK13849.1 putative membrane protein [Herbaspirillum sp. SJZ106]TWC69572.1 putative membrane protein [Herbaspirillum sp. SJZ099]
MQGFKRKFVYACMFELLAICFTTFGLAVIAGHDGAHSTAAAVASSTVAFIWNFIFNGLFERWEARQAKRGRGVGRRIAHALGFEGGLVLMLVPLFAWWLDIGLWDAFVLDLGLIVFFMVYTYLFNLVFDKVFGLPSSAMPAPQT